MIYVLLPAYNEEANLPPLLRRMGNVLDNIGPYSIYVLDDGSSDGTASVVEGLSSEMNIVLLRHPRNMGLAAALRTGLNALAEVWAGDDVLITMDADNTHPPESIPAMMGLLSSGYDIVIASRFVPGATMTGLSTFRRALSLGASLLFRAVFPIKNVKDYTCGFRVYRVGVLDRAMRAYGEGFVSEKGFSCMVDILLKLRPYGLRAIEAPLYLQYDLKLGQSKMKVMRTVFQTLWLMVRRLVQGEKQRGGQG